MDSTASTSYCLPLDFRFIRIPLPLTGSPERTNTTESPWVNRFPVWVFSPSMYYFWFVWLICDICKPINGTCVYTDSYIAFTIRRAVYSTLSLHEFRSVECPILVTSTSRWPSSASILTDWLSRTEWMTSVPSGMGGGGGRSQWGRGCGLPGDHSHCGSGDSAEGPSRRSSSSINQLPRQCLLVSGGLSPCHKACVISYFKFNICVAKFCIAPHRWQDGTRNVSTAQQLSIQYTSFTTSSRDVTWSYI